MMMTAFRPNGNSYYWIYTLVLDASDNHARACVLSSSQLGSVPWVAFQTPVAVENRERTINEVRGGDNGNDMKGSCFSATRSDGRQPCPAVTGVPAEQEHAKILQLRQQPRCPYGTADEYFTPRSTRSRKILIFYLVRNEGTSQAEDSGILRQARGEDFSSGAAGRPGAPGQSKCTWWAY